MKYSIDSNNIILYVDDQNVTNVSEIIAMHKLHNQVEIVVSYNLNSTKIVSLFKSLFLAKQITKLKCIFNDVSEEVINCFCISIADYKHLDSIDFSSNQLVLSNQINILHIIRVNVIQNINLDGLQFRDSFLTKLSTILLECKGLKILSIAQNALTETSAKVINNIIDNVQIKELILSGNNLGVKGAQIISESLKSNLSISFLSLSLNNIDSSGIVAILASVEKNKTIKNLDLSGNNPNFLAAVANLNSSLHSDKIIQQISNTLISNKSLEALNLYGNIQERAFKSQWIEKIFSALSGNYTIHVLWLDVMHQDITSLLERNIEAIRNVSSILSKVDTREELETIFSIDTFCNYSLMGKAELYKQILQKSSNNINRAEFWTSKQGEEDIESLICSYIKQDDNDIDGTNPKSFKITDISDLSIGCIGDQLELVNFLE